MRVLIRDRVVAQARRFRRHGLLDPVDRLTASYATCCDFG
jgi:hypothetical protein